MSSSPKAVFFLMDLLHCLFEAGSVLTFHLKIWVGSCEPVQDLQCSYLNGLGKGRLKTLQEYAHKKASPLLVRNHLDVWGMSMPCCGRWQSGLLFG